MSFCVGSARFSLDGFSDMNVCVAVCGLKQTGDLSIVYSAYCTLAFGSFSSNNVLMIHFYIRTRKRKEKEKKKNLFVNLSCRA